VINLLVEWGTRAELNLGAMEQNRPCLPVDTSNSSVRRITSSLTQQVTSTKPDGHLRQKRLQYTADGQALLDSDKDAVMMEWERPLMKAHAQIMLENAPRKRVMNIGFGMGIIDTAIQEWQPELHVICEAHPDVHRRMLADGWDKKPNVRICFGKWQDWLPKLIQEGIELDGVFYDTVCFLFTG
jgi:protein arginine N-methyltransferase 2